MGGNIGTAILALEPPASAARHVIEMSSFQIELTPTLEPTVGILLNVSPDHLDRHGTHGALRRPQGAAGAGGASTRSSARTTTGAAIFAERLRLANRTWVDIVSANSRVAHGWYAQRHCADQQRAVDRPARRLRRPRRHRVTARPAQHPERARSQRGRHALLGVAPEQVAAALATFPACRIAWRRSASLGAALFINDSKATNADSAATALAAFDSDVYWILGGKPKQGGITSLASFFPRVAKAYLIGEATEEFAATLQGKVAFERCGTLDARRRGGGSRCDGQQRQPTRRPACRRLAPPSTSTATSRSRRRVPRAGGEAAGIELRGMGQHELSRVVMLTGLFAATARDTDRLD